jgi:hypothetical protein
MWEEILQAALPVIGGLFGHHNSNKAASQGTNAILGADQQAIDYLKQMYGQAAAGFSPYQSAGTGALADQQKFLGGDWSGFENSPSYKYALDQGLNAIDSRAAARGGLFGGGNTRDAINYGEGLALQNSNDYYNKLTGLSNQGLSATGSVGNLYSSLGNNVADIMGSMGQARASGYQQTANNNNNLIGGLTSIAGNLLGGLGNNSTSAAPDFNWSLPNNSSYGSGYGNTWGTGNGLASAGYGNNWLVGPGGG